MLTRIKLRSLPQAHLLQATGGTRRSHPHPRCFVSRGWKDEREEVYEVKMKIDKIEKMIAHVKGTATTTTGITQVKQSFDEKCKLGEKSELQDVVKGLRDILTSLKYILRGLQDKECRLLDPKVVGSDKLKLDVSQVKLDSPTKHRLVGGFGADWVYQGSEFMVDQIAAPLIIHFTAWKERRRDSRLHPLFHCFNGSGSGRSKLGEEFAKLCKQAAEKEDVQDLVKRLNGPNVVEFRVSFDNDTMLFDDSECDSTMGAGQPVATRMIYEMLTSSSKSFHSFQHEMGKCSPKEVIDHVVHKLGIQPNELTVFLSVDAFSRFENDENKLSVYKALTELINSSSEEDPFVVVLTTASKGWVEDSLLDQFAPGQLRKHLTPPPVDWRAQFGSAQYFQTACDRFGPHCVEMLLDDMGDWGRTIEKASSILASFDTGSFLSRNLETFMDVVDSTRRSVEGVYHPAVHNMQSSFEPYLLYLLLFRVPVTPLTPVYSLYRWCDGQKYVRDFLSHGMLRLVKHPDESFVLTCPYFLIHMSTMWGINYYKVAALMKQEKNDVGVEDWAAFKDFVAELRALKFDVLKVIRRGVVSLEELYPGAQFLHESDKRILVHLGERALDDHHMMDLMTQSCRRFPAPQQAVTKRSAYIGSSPRKGRSFSPDKGVFRNVANAPGADVFQLVEVQADPSNEDTEWVMLNENIRFHQHTEKELSWDEIQAEREQTCDPEDILVLITNAGVTSLMNDRERNEVTGTRRTILINKDMFQDVYGPFAGKASFLTEVHTKSHNRLT